jgi:hypothetical protein
MEERSVMKKQWIVAGVLAAVLLPCQAGSLLAQHKAPNQQPTTAPTPTAPTGEVALGAVRIPRSVMADGKPLPAGTYQVKVTAQEARPEAVGTTEPLERWAEFSQRGQVRGREVVTIVPDSEIKMVVKDTPPRGAPKVQTLRGNDYLRVWVNKGGTHYLIHLPTGAPATTGQ